MRRTTDIINDTPCKDCEDRYEACHSKCEKYKAFKDELAESTQMQKDERASRCALGTAWERGKRFQNGKNAKYLERKKIQNES